MRVYKVDNKYIDLDHVLVVSELEHWKTYTNEFYDAWFFVTLAFREDKLKIGFRYTEGMADWTDEEIQAMARKDYELFIAAWQNK